MIKIEEQKSNYWYAFVIIGLLIGAVIGYYASEKEWLGSSAVGKPPKLVGFRCTMGTRSVTAMASEENVADIAGKYVEDGWDCTVYTHGYEEGW